VSSTLSQVEFSSEYQRLSDFFFDITPPFSKQDVYAFNNIYRTIYQKLPRHEKCKAEWLVDLLIENVEDPELIKLIYGVV
jgi:hypothetical protein